MRRGFTIFFAVLVSSLALAVGLAIFDLVTRELVLSQTTTQSQYAIFAADTGVECALYWDSKFGEAGFPSIFAAPPSVSGLGAGVALCNGQDVYTHGTPPSPYADPPTDWISWDQASSTSGELSIITTFTVGFATGCAKVVVTKAGSPAATTVVSRGYNTCAAESNVRVERALQISY